MAGSIMMMIPAASFCHEPCWDVPSLSRVDAMLSWARRMLETAESSIMVWIMRMDSKHDEGEEAVIIKSL